ncbi:ribonuclease H-like domain-containing protein, partial [Mycena galericulata]
MNPGLPHLREKIRNARESEEYLDVLLRETLESRQTPDEKRAAFYGLVHDGVGNPVQVYTDGSCFDNGLSTARAGAGVYFGPGSSRNVSLRVTGQQTNNRGELLAILHVLSTIPMYTPLKIHSDSEYCIRSIVYWAPGHAERGWKCANADLLRDIVSWLKFRSAPVEFVHVKAHSGNGHNDGADMAAKAGA